MAAPAHIAAAQASNVSTSVQIVIPTEGPGGVEVEAGQKVLLGVTLTPSIPSANPTDMTPIDDTADEPTNSGGRMYLWEGEITSGGNLDPGDTITVPLQGNSRWSAGLVIAEAGAEISEGGVGKYAPVPAIAGSGDGTLASPGCSATDAARAYHWYGVNGQTNAASPAWTPAENTTELVDTSSAHGSAKNSTLCVAHEATGGPGAVPARTAVSNQQVQPSAFTVALVIALDRPTATPDSDITVAGGGSFELGVTPSGGSGAPYTYQWTQTGGTSTVLDDDEAQEPSGTAGSIAETLTFQVVVTDDEGTPSFAATQLVHVLGASDTAVPDQDITTTSWSKEPSGAPSFSSLLADVSDASYASVANPNGGQPLEVGLSELAEPGDADPVTLSVRCSILSGSSGPVDVVLKEGASTVIGTWSRTVSQANEVQQFDLELTSGQIASVGDWGNLRVVIDPGAVT